MKIQKSPVRKFDSLQQISQFLYNNLQFRFPGQSAYYSLIALHFKNKTTLITNANKIKSIARLIFDNKTNEKEHTNTKKKPFIQKTNNNNRIAR